MKEARYTNISCPSSHQGHISGLAHLRLPQVAVGTIICLSKNTSFSIF